LFVCSFCFLEGFGSVGDEAAVEEVEEDIVVRREDGLGV